MQSEDGQGHSAGKGTKGDVVVSSCASELNRRHVLTLGWRIGEAGAWARLDGSNALAVSSSRLGAVLLAGGWRAVWLASSSGRGLLAFMAFLS
jgi:DNA-binding IclR family transcriptional regulator